MQKQNSYADYKYVVNGREGFELTIALRLWKTKYQDDIRLIITKKRTKISS